MSFITWVKKWKKDLLITFTILLAITVAVMGWHWTETADKPFWSDFWMVAAIVALLACFGGWLYLKSRDKGKK